MTQVGGFYCFVSFVCICICDVFVFCCVSFYICICVVFLLIKGGLPTLGSENFMFYVLPQRKTGCFCVCGFVIFAIKLPSCVISLFIFVLVSRVVSDKRGILFLLMLKFVFLLYLISVYICVDLLC